MTHLPAALVRPAAAATLTMAGELGAIINKQLVDRGRDPFATPADIANALFDGSSAVNTALRVLTALVLLGAVFATVAGIWQIFRGDRGGLELASSGVFGVIVLLVGVTVVM
ncbi:MAG: hypothetical protein MSC31_18345 [Solirubrobacteraceae bacterium MAG38_C4-C5]|nr:hypothetical protein [Candidatus Siliceabacter maunaloa]